MSKEYDDWMKELESEEKAHKDYRKKAQKVVDRYEDEQERDDSEFNILWSNTEVIHSALYAKSPTPDIRRRYLDRDPDGKEAAELAERAVSYSIDTKDFDGAVDTSVDDYLVPGMGVMRLRYKPYFDEVDGPRIELQTDIKGYDETTFEPLLGVYNDAGEEIQDYQTDGIGFFMDSDPVEELVYEEVEMEPVNWKRFRWQPSARWEDTDWCCIEHYMTKDEIKESYGKEYCEVVPLGFTDKGEKATVDDDKSRAKIYEIFDRKTRTNFEMAEGYDEILKREDDPLGLEGFYPFPKPLMATLKNGKFIPIPDYLFYQDQAMELDKITSRINALTDQLKYRGVYDGSFKALANVVNNDDGDFTPVDDFFDRFQGKGDLSAIIAAMPLEEIQRVLLSLYEAREQVKQTIYEITGIADIMRGSSNSNETLGAQQLKTQFGSMRLQRRQRVVAQFVRDIVRMKVEIMVENFQPETLQMMTGTEITPEIMSILKDDMMRSYRIDIETDSTISEDANLEKQNRIDLVKAVTEYVGVVAPQVQAGLMPISVAKELLSFAVRGFKIGRTLEDTLDEIGGNEKDPRMQQMEGMMKQQVEQIQGQAQQALQGMQEQSQKEKQQLEGKIFDLEKKLAITGATNQAKITDSRIKADIQVQAQQDKNDLIGQIEMFKAQLDAIQRIPDERANQMGQLIESIGQAFQQQQDHNEKSIKYLNEQIEATNSNVADMTEYMKKPAKIIRDNKGRVTGATRD